MKSRFNKVMVLCSVISWIMITSATAQPLKMSLPTGTWQGTLHRQDGENIAFNFTVATTNHRTVLYIRNAGERLLVDSIRQQGDSLWIQMPFFNSRFALQIKKGGSLEGNYITDAQRTEKTLPQLDSLQAFPTTIFIGKNGKVDKIHTGYDGPATGVHYEDFKKEFEEEVDKLLKE